MRSIKQGKFRQHTFNVLSKNTVKGNKASLKKDQLIEDQGEVISEHQDRKHIEEEVIKHKNSISLKHTVRKDIGIKYIIDCLTKM